jgi:eukaryotic-like serine/threonine-protein kinase
VLAANGIVGGRYRVVKLLGGGGMKQVYFVEDLRLAKRPCALAEMLDNFADPDMQRKAALAVHREAEMLAALENPHIPRVYDNFSEQNRHYLVMEYVEGATLEEKLALSRGKLEEDAVIDIGLQTAEALEYLHGLIPLS